MAENKLGLASMTVIATLLAGCAAEVPKCSDPKTMSLIRQILVGQFYDNHPAKSLSAKEMEDKLLIDLPRATSIDEKIKKLSCEAKLVAPTKDGDQRLELEIRYTSQLDDKNEHLVAVGTIGRGDLYAIAGAVEKNINKSKQPVPAPQAEVIAPKPVDPPPPQVTQPATEQQAAQDDTVEKDGICKGLDLAITSDQHECLGRKFTVADKELNAEYKQLMARLDDGQKASLKKEQIAWIKQKESKCAKAGKEFEGGTLEGIMIGDCKVQMTEDRVTYLKKY